MNLIYNLINEIAYIFKTKRNVEGRMDQREIILCGLAPEKGAAFTPVQVQKLFFLLDMNIADSMGGKMFDFQPYNYGPFDKNVYQILENLRDEGLVEIVPQYSWRTYKLTSAGQIRGETILEAFNPTAKQFVIDASLFVRKLSFTQLISAIYKAFPEMKVNSVFQE